MRDGADELLTIFAVHGSVIAALRAENDRLRHEVAALGEQLAQLAAARATETEG